MVRKFHLMALLAAPLALAACSGTGNERAMSTTTTSQDQQAMATAQQALQTAQQAQQTANEAKAQAAQNYQRGLQK